MAKALELYLEPPWGRGKNVLLKIITACDEFKKSNKYRS